MRGFTLIELIVVVTIIGILAIISLPIYSIYTVNAAEKACMYEAKAYSNVLFTEIYDQDSNKRNILPPSLNACLDITDASKWIDLSNQPLEIIAIPKQPGKAKTICKIEAGAPCTVI